MIELLEARRAEAMAALDRLAADDEGFDDAVAAVEAVDAQIAEAKVAARELHEADEAARDARDAEIRSLEIAALRAAVS